MRRLLAVVAILVLTSAVVASGALLDVDGGVIQSFDVEVSIPTDDLVDDGVVWLCKLVGPPGHPRLQSEDPIRVSVNALGENGEFPDAHPSYFVEEGEKCTWPREDTAETESTATTDVPTDDQKGAGPPQESDGEGEATTPPEATDTTSASTSTTSTTIAPTTTSTTPSLTTTIVPTPTTAPEPPGDEST